jgi:hypothetical protein
MPGHDRSDSAAEGFRETGEWKRVIRDGVTTLDLSSLFLLQSP